jgi:hypothetical protein
MMVNYPPKVRLLICCTLVMIWIGSSCADSGVIESSYVSLADDNCFQPTSDTLHLYSIRSLGVVECRVKNTAIRLFVVSSEERSWIDVAVGDKLWSTEDPIVYAPENQFGYFPNVGATPVELDVNQKQVPIGLILRVTAQDPNQQNQGSANISRLFVFGFRKEGVCFLGLTDNNVDARSFLQTDVNCRQLLKSSRLIQN